MKENPTSFERNEGIDKQTKNFQPCPSPTKKNLKTLGGEQFTPQQKGLTTPT